MIYDIFNCNWVATRWQQYSTHLHTDNTQNDTKQTIHRTTQAYNVLLYIHCVYTLCTHYVHIMYTLCTHYVHIMYTLCTHYIHIMCTLCTHYVHIMYTLCTHYVHIMYTLCTMRLRRNHKTNTLLTKHALYRDADKSLARPGRK